MPVNRAPTTLSAIKSSNREQEFALALARYMDSYREAQAGRGRVSPARRWLTGLLALTERGPTGSKPDLIAIRATGEAIRWLRPWSIQGQSVRDADHVAPQSLSR